MCLTFDCISSDLVSVRFLLLVYVTERMKGLQGFLNQSIIQTPITKQGERKNHLPCFGEDVLTSGFLSSACCTASMQHCSYD